MCVVCSVAFDLLIYSGPHVVVSVIQIVYV